MKTLLTILISTILLADSIHNFKAVSFYNKSLKSVQLILDDDEQVISIWHQGIKLSDEFIIISCTKPEGFCMVMKQKPYNGEIK